MNLIPNRSRPPRTVSCKTVVQRFAHEGMPASIALNLIQWGPGQHFDQGYELDAEDIEVGMPFLHVSYCFV
jgi:hypothetical protein